MNANAVASVHDLTRTCALSGISAEKWMDMIRLRAAKYPTGSSEEADAEEICRALIPLLLSFPTSDTISNYLSAALDSPLLPLPTYLHVFPSLLLATPDVLSHPALLMKLVSLALRSHYSYSTTTTTATDAPPAVLSQSNSTRNVQTIEGVANLLKVSYSLQAMSTDHHMPADGLQTPQTTYQHQICESLTTLLVLLLSAISTTSPPLPPQPAGALIQCITELIQQYPVSHESRPAFDSWLMSFSLSAGAIGLGESFDSVMSGNTRNADGNTSSDKEAIPEEEDMVSCAAALRRILEARRIAITDTSADTEAISVLLTAYRSTIIPPLKPMNTMSSQNQNAVGTQGQTPHSGATPGAGLAQTPAATGTAGRTPAPVGQTPNTTHHGHTHSHSQSIHGPLQNFLGVRTPLSQGQLAHHAPTPLGPSSYHTPGGNPASAYTPSGLGPGAGRTPGGNPRTPAASGRTNQASSSPSHTRNASKPSQIRAQVFLEKLLQAASALVVEGDARQPAAEDETSGEVSVARAFVLGKLPNLVSLFTKIALTSSASAPINRPDFKAAMESSLMVLFTKHTSVLDACDSSSRAKTSEMDEGKMHGVEGASELPKGLASRGHHHPPYRQLLLGCLVHADLISSDFARSLYPEMDSLDDNSQTAEKMEEARYGIPSDVLMSGAGESPGKMPSNDKLSRQGRMFAEAEEAGLSLEVYMESKISQVYSSDDLLKLVNTWLGDYHCHAALATTIEKRFSSLLSTADLEPLSVLSRVLYQHDQLMGIFTLHISFSDFLIPGLQFLEDFNFDSVGDPQWALTHLGEIILFMQVCVYKHNLTNVSLKSPSGRNLSTRFLHNASIVYAVETLPKETQAVIKNWLETAFDNNSEGIDDQLLRSTHPKTLLAISGTLFVEAISKTENIDTLRLGGASYFLVNLLSWTLVGVIRALIDQSLKKAFANPAYLQVLQMLVLDSGCPHAVLQMTARPLLRLAADPYMQTVFASASFDAAAVKKVSYAAIGISSENLSSATTSPPDVQTCLQQFVTSSYNLIPPPSLSSLLQHPPHRLLDAVFTVLVQIAGTRDARGPTRYLVNSLLTLKGHKSPSGPPPLVALLIRSFVVSLLPGLDSLPPAERNTSSDVLACLVSCSLIQALRLERAAWDVAKWEKDQKQGAGDESFGSDHMDIESSDGSPGNGKEVDDDVFASSQVTKMAEGLSMELKSSKSQVAASLYKDLVSSPSFLSNFPSFLKPQSKIQSK